MHSTKSGKFANGSTATVKKISFNNDTNRHRSDSRKHSTDNAKIAESKTNLQERNNEHIINGDLETAQPIPSTSACSSSGVRQHIKVKRKSLTGISRCVKKRLSSVECTIHLSSDSNDGSANLLEGETAINSSDSLSEFWGDDQLFADFNISEVIHSSIESSSNKYNLASTPKVKTNSKEKGSDLNEINDKETFYGLPMNVKSMISQYRGIEELYGESYNNLM